LSDAGDVMHLPRHAEIWLPGYLRAAVEARREGRHRRGVTDIMLCVADHYEPMHNHASAAVGDARVAAWRDRLPLLAREFVDADGRHPQHTFFFPIEQYTEAHLDILAALAAQGLGEVEIHLHHEGDTADHLRRELLRFKQTLHTRHGLLSRDPQGVVRYGFIHGDWALDNSLPDGSCCGVNDELTVLRDTGCYADFTMPAAPSPAQTRTVNRIYYATGNPAAPRSHETGIRASVGRRPGDGSLLMVQGPLSLDWRRAKWGVVPRLENGSLHGGHPATLSRFANWLARGISVEGRPDWVFVKAHTHGALEHNAAVLLGPQMRDFHRLLLAAYNDGERYRLHYVTAREMVNMIHAAEAGESGNPSVHRDYRYPPPPCRAPTAGIPR
jgi:hypothetical protein